MDLSRQVMLKGDLMTFDTYRQTAEHEQQSSLAWLRSPEVHWHVPESLKLKVNADGSLLPFFGDTTVLPLSKEEIVSVNKFQTELRKDMEDIFAEPLDPEQFHVTLHDLSFDTTKSAGEAKMRENEKKCSSIFQSVASYLQENSMYSKVKLHSTHVYPSCNISVVMGFVPETDCDYRVLMNLYNLFDEVVYLNYWLRPHVTLSYFRPYELSSHQIAQLADKLDELQLPRVHLDLDLYTLAYQHFTTMNHYKTEFSLFDFSG